MNQTECTSIGAAYVAHAYDLGMSSEVPHVQSFDDADTRRALPGGTIELIRLGGLDFDRATFGPGWRWSEHAGSASCRERHLGYLVSGCMRFRMDDGTEVQAGAGSVYLVPPGHDAWVVGDEPCVALDLTPSPASGRRS